MSAADAADRRNVALRALVCLDLTNLDTECDAAAIDTLCARAQTRYGSVAAVCVWPRFVVQARERLARTGIRTSTVVDFPAGTGGEVTAADEARAALADGAEEIDMVVPWQALRDGKPEAVSGAVAAVRAAIGDTTLKAILETGDLADPALIGLAAERALAGGADFLKTSTGKTGTGATLEAAEILLRAISRADRRAGFKASGGVRTLEDARVYLDLADRIMGGGWAGPQHFRIGASGLLDAVLATAGGSAGASAEDESDY